MLDARAAGELKPKKAYEVMTELVAERAKNVKIPGSA